MKIRHGDTVIVITGKDKGKTGTVERVLKRESLVIVTGINMRTRHIKKTAQAAGRKIRYEAAIAISKVMIVDPKTKKPSRVGFTVKDGKKMRVARASGTEIVKAAQAKPKKVAAKATEKDTDDKKTKKAAPAESAPSDGGKKQPFWQRMKFGSAALEQAEVPETPHAEKDQSIPAQQIHRKGGRGS